MALRELFAHLASDPEWISAGTQRLTTAIHAELPELNVDPEMRAATYASSESVIRLMTDMLATDADPAGAVLPPAAVEYARAFVRQGVAIDTLLRAYQVGHSAFFEFWTAEVHRAVDDADERAAAIEEGASWTFAYVGALSRGLVERYGAERELWVRSAAAVRTQTVREILGGGRVDRDAASRRLRYELDRRHLGFVVWSVGDEDNGDTLAGLERVAFELAARLGFETVLTAPLGTTLVAVWVGSREPIEVPEPELVRFAAEPGAPLVALGEPGEGIDGFRRSYRQAMRARGVAQLSSARPGSGVRYRDVALTALASSDPDHAREFVETELGTLAGEDDHSRRLAATLRVYLEEQSSPRRTAQRLGVHENTIANRIKAAQSQLDNAIEPRIAELLVALRLARLIAATNGRSA